MRKESKRHVRVGLARLAEADRMADLLQRGAASRTCSHVAGDWPIEFQRSWRQIIGAGTRVVGDAEVLPRLRVERAPPTEIAVAADRALDLAHDRLRGRSPDPRTAPEARGSRRCRDRAVPSPRRRRGREAPCTARARSRPRRRCALPSRSSPRSEPGVVAWDDVRPLDDGELCPRASGPLCRSGPANAYGGGRSTDRNRGSGQLRRAAEEAATA